VIFLIVRGENSFDILHKDFMERNMISKVKVLSGKSTSKYDA